MSWPKGKPLPREHREKISESHKGKKVPEETRKKISETMKGRERSEETKRKISETRRELFEEGKLKVWNEGAISLSKKDAETIIKLLHRAEQYDRERGSNGWADLASYQASRLAGKL